MKLISLKRRTRTLLRGMRSRSDIAKERVDVLRRDRDRLLESQVKTNHGRLSLVQRYDVNHSRDMYAYLCG